MVWWLSWLKHLLVHLFTSLSGHIKNKISLTEDFKKCLTSFCVFIHTHYHLYSSHVTPSTGLGAWVWLGTETKPPPDKGRDHAGHQTSGCWRYSSGYRPSWCPPDKSRISLAARESKTPVMDETPGTWGKSSIFNPLNLVTTPHSPICGSLVIFFMTPWKNPTSTGKRIRGIKENWVTCITVGSRHYQLSTFLFWRKLYL